MNYCLMLRHGNKPLTDALWTYGLLRTHFKEIWFKSQPFALQKNIQECLLNFSPPLGIIFTFAYEFSFPSRHNCVTHFSSFFMTPEGEKRNHHSPVQDELNRRVTKVIPATHWCRISNHLHKYFEIFNISRSHYWGITKNCYFHCAPVHIHLRYPHTGHYISCPVNSLFSQKSIWSMHG